MKTFFLDLFPDYILFAVSCTKADGTKINPSASNLIIYDEDGNDSVFSSTQITGSPFTPIQINSKVGLYGILIAKSSFTVGRYYNILWEMTIDGIDTHKNEIYFACNSSSFKSDVSLVSLETTSQLIKAKTDVLPIDPATVTKQNEIIADVAAISEGRNFNTSGD